MCPRQEIAYGSVQTGMVRPHDHHCIIRSLNSSWLAYNVICGMLRAQAVQELFSRFEGFGCSKDEVVRALKQEDNRTERAAAVLLERYPDAQ